MVPSHPATIATLIPFSPVPSCPAACNATPPEFNPSGGRRTATARHLFSKPESAVNDATVPERPTPPAARPRHREPTPRCNRNNATASAPSATSPAKSASTAPANPSLDFTPGDKLSDYTTAFVRVSSSRSMKVTSHVENLAQSACSRASGTRLWCGTLPRPSLRPPPLPKRYPGFVRNAKPATRRRCAGAATTASPVICPPHP